MSSSDHPDHGHQLYQQKAEALYQHYGAGSYTNLIQNTPRSGLAAIQMFLDIVMEILITWPPLLVKVFLRPHHWGQRALPVTAVIGLPCLLCYFVVPNTSWTVAVYALVFFLVSLYHLREIYVRRRTGQLFHSQFDGESWSWWWKIPVPWQLKEWHVKAFFEPALVTVVGGLMALECYTWGMLVIVLGLFCGAQSYLRHQLQQEKFVATIDQILEQEAFQASLLGQSPEPRHNNGSAGPDFPLQVIREKLASHHLPWASQQKGPAKPAPANGMVKPRDLPWHSPKLQPGAKAAPPTVNHPRSSTNKENP